MSGQKTRSAIEALLETMRILRAPDGCPWDAEQTPESLTPYILEEACELIDSIETGDPEQIKDELGDLLLQVVFQAQIFTERKTFDFADVADAITTKLLRRHPHVFATDKPPTEIDLDRQWHEIKLSEKTHRKKSSCISDHLPNRLPSLQRAQKLITKAKQAGLPIPGPRFQSERDGGDSPKRSSSTVMTEERLGWELFKLVEQAERLGLDAERALRQTMRDIISQLSPLADNKGSVDV